MKYREGLSDTFTSTGTLSRILQSAETNQDMGDEEDSDFEYSDGEQNQIDEEGA